MCNFAAVEDDVLIVVPVYSSSPSAFELRSLRQLLGVSPGREVRLYTHLGCDVSPYRRAAAEVGRELGVELFDGAFFASARDYNRLCLTRDFYERARPHTHILIHQLDAWLFRDELSRWTMYDYVGAPIYLGDALVGVGNGGLSLRRVEHCLRVLDLPRWLPYLTPAGVVWYYRLERRSGRALWRCVAGCALKLAGWHNTVGHYLGGAFNEDWVLSVLAGRSWWLRPLMPSPAEAGRFSQERREAGPLPMGLHAVQKWGNEHLTTC